MIMPPKLRRPRRLKLNNIKKMTKGACSRQRRLCKEMVNALDQARENGVRSAASELGIAPSLISKWKKQESKLREQVLKEKAAALTGAKLRKGKFVARPTKLPYFRVLLEKMVYEAARERCKNRRVLNGNTIVRLAKQKLAKIAEMGYEVKQCGQPWVPRKWWAYAFLHMNRFISRRRSNKRTMSPAVAATVMRLFVKLQRRRIFKTKKIARKNRINIDQIPMMLDHQHHRTFIPDTSTDFVCVSSISGADKRFCTYQMGVCGDGQLLPPYVIFRGQGKTKAMKEEAALYAEGITVAWQPKAWADSPIAMDGLARQVLCHVEKNFKRGVGCAKTDYEPWVLYCDSLGSQRKRAFVESVQAVNGQVVYGPKNASHIWQPVDCGHLGALTKSLLSVVMEEWMERPCAKEGWDGKANWELWENGLETGEKRILFTHWMSDVHGRMSSVKYSSQMIKSFEMGGCAVGDGGGLTDIEADAKIYIPGLEGKWRGPDPEEEWTAEDEAWFDDHFTGSESFNFCEAKPKAAAAPGPGAEPVPGACSSSDVSDDDSGSSSSSDDAPSDVSG